MGRQREDAEIDCATERDEKAEEEEMGGDEREDAESESHEDGGVCRDAGGDDDCFFESLDRVPSGVSFDLDLPSSASESDDDDNDDDVRVSFATAIEAPRFSICITDFDDFLHDDEDGSGGFDYGIWMAEPVSLSERRRRLLRGMGLASRKGIPPSKTFRDGNSAALRVASNRFRPPLPPSAASKPIPSAPSTPPLPAQFPSELTLSRPLLVRSLSDRHLPCQAPASARLLRSHSLPPSPWLGNGAVKNSGEFEAEARRENGQDAGGDAGACKIKNLDTGKEFVMSGIGKDGSFGRLNDVQTGLQLTMDEFDRFIGFSPLVKELMRRVNLAGDKKKTGGGKSSSTCGVKSSKSGGRKRGNWLKNIKFVASSVTGLISEREWDNGNSVSGAGATATSGGSGRKYSFLNGNSADRLKVHRHGKSHKELTGLYMSQEIQAHQGSIWCMRFSADGRFLASAGEDRTVHVWQVTESDPFSTFAIRRQETLISAAGPSPAANRSASSRSDHASILGAHASKRTRKESKSGSRRRSLPDYVVLPETIFSISESPACSFEGHLDDVLDLSWSKSQHLLSSSMDKTVRLWDMESKACLKLFAHNDYVTCIQFNPTDDDYFISGSLDGKARIWSIPNRQVVDWSDLHEMVTAVCYTPDGQGALVGSHKGSFRLYRTSDDKISQESQVDVRSKKKKSHAKKITGFQHAPGNSSEVMVTSADSQIRVFDGVNIVHKFRGFRNTSSQISASFSADGKYVVCASEDSNVYIWKRDAGRGGGGGGGKSKGWSTTRSHEYFYCKDVSVAVPWPNVGSNCEKPSLPSAFSKSLEAAGLEDPFSSGRSNRPLPVPPKKGSPEQVVLPTSPDAMQASLLGSSSPSRSLRSSVNSSSSFSSWGWGGGSSRVAAGGPESANAWGLVVVTAGLGGNIRVYQNFGLPVRLSRQNSLF